MKRDNLTIKKDTKNKVEERKLAPDKVVTKDQQIQALPKK